MHSLKHGCTNCHSHRFNVGEKELAEAKAKHRKECKGPKKKEEAQKNTPEPLEWMTEEQEKDYEKLDLRKSRQDNLKETFQKIYSHLWPKSVPVPDYRHGAGSRVSVFIAIQVLEKMSIESIETAKRPSSASLQSQQPLSYGKDAAVESEHEEDRIMGQEEPADMPGASDPYCSDFMNDPGTNTSLMAATNNNSNYLGATSFYGNSINTPEPSSYLPASYPPQLIPHLSHNSSSGNDQLNMSQPVFAEHVNMAHPADMKPFPYTLPRSTGPSQSHSDSGYATNPPADNDGYNIRPPYRPQQQYSNYGHGHGHNANLLGSDCLVFKHTGGSCGPDNPPDGEDLQVDEDNGEDDLAMFGGFPAQASWPGF